MGSLALDGDLATQLEAFRNTDIARQELTEVRFILQYLNTFGSGQITQSNRDIIYSSKRAIYLHSALDIQDFPQSRKQLAKDVYRLREQLDHITSDLEDQSRLRRDYKLRAELAEKANSRNPYVLVLVDADGYIFNEKWLKDSESGGIEAAYGLRTEVLRYLKRQVGLNLPSEYDIVVNMYANQRGLAKAIVEAGFLPDTSAFDNFVCKLNQSQPLFLWADCGPGKERVDAKIRENYRFHAYQSSCRAIFLACCHDSGYVAEFNKYRRDPIVEPKTVLVRAAAQARGFNDLSFAQCELGMVFQDEPLKAKSTPKPRPAVAVTETVEPVQPPQTNGVPIKPTYSSAAMDFPIIMPTRPASQAQVQAPKPTSPPPNPDKVPVNRFGQRIDTRLKSASQRDEDRFHDRINEQKLCNAYYLGGYCYNGDRCHYDHSAIDDGIKLVLQRTARQILCRDGGHCRKKGCYMGHQCPFFPECYSSNTGRRCAFKAKELCGVDTSITGYVEAV
ncbi:MAG: hypothetical protein Q9160_006180 [Pyrenula sp. 1 TL-2023]